MKMLKNCSFFDTGKDRVAKVICSISRRGLLFSITIALLLPVSGASEEAEGGLPVVELQLKGKGIRGPYFLGDQIIIKGSERVWVDGAAKREGRDYKIDYSENWITLVRPVPRGSIIRVRFLRVPFHIRRVYQHRLMLPPEAIRMESEETAVLVKGDAGGWSSATRPRWSAESASDLHVSGSKSFGITLGSNRDLSLEQTLRIAISGRVGDDMEILALLTDQNSPIQPEGNTQTLQDLEKVLVEVKKGNFKVTLGDYDLSLERSELGHYKRKLQGIRSTISLPGLRLMAAGAVSGGEFHTNRFMGVEGNQGPYQLRARDGNTEIVVLAGSEKVWLDGELMRRGENNDYIIEYSTGEITFTQRRLITSESRITVDFEYSTRRYKRNLGCIRGEAEFWDGKTKIGGTLIREADDKGAPIQLNLSTKEKELLELVGDDAMSAWISNVDSSSTGRGYYTVAYDTLDDGQPYRYYRFDPDGQGAYNISFSWVGDRKGDYNYIGGGIYEYAGKGKGSYMPRTYLPLPRSHQLGVLDFSLSPVGVLKFGGEVGISGLDLNTFSRKDDGDNVGSAYKFRATLQPFGLSAFGNKLGDLRMSLRYRFIGGNFYPMGRISEVDRSYKWGIGRDIGTEPDPRSSEGQVEVNLGGEKELELSGIYRPTSGAALTFEYGQIRTRSGFSSTRHKMEAVVNERGTSEARYSLEVIRPAGRDPLIRQRGWTQSVFWGFKPEFGYQAEEVPGGGFREIEAGLSSDRWNPLTWSCNWKRRKDYLPGERSIALTQRYQVELTRWRALSFGIGYTHRTRDFLRDTQQDQSNSLANLKLDFSPLKGALSTQVHYEATRTRVARKLRNYLYVGKGRGVYIWEDLDKDGKRSEDEFIPDPDGDYILYIERVGEFQPVTRLTGDARLKLEPGKLFGKGGAEGSLLERFLGGLSSDSFLRWEESGREGGLLGLGRFQADSTLVRSSFAFWQDIYLFGKGRNLSLRLRYRLHRDINNEYYNGKEELYSLERSLRLRMRPTKKVSIELEYVNGEKSRERVNGLDYRIISHKVQGGLFHRPTSHLELSLKPGFGSNRDLEDGARASLFSLDTGLSYRFRGRGTLKAHLDYSRVESDRSVLTYRMAEGRWPGDNYSWNMGFDYKVGRYVNSSVYYNGRKRPGRETIHSARAEMRAYF